MTQSGDPGSVVVIPERRPLLVVFVNVQWIEQAACLAVTWREPGVGQTVAGGAGVSSMKMRDDGDARERPPSRVGTTDAGVHRQQVRQGGSRWSRQPVPPFHGDPLVLLSNERPARIRGRLRCVAVAPHRSRQRSAVRRAQPKILPELGDANIVMRATGGYRPEDMCGIEQIGKRIDEFRLTTRIEEDGPRALQHASGCNNSRGKCRTNKRTTSHVKESSLSRAHPGINLAYSSDS